MGEITTCQYQVRFPDSTRWPGPGPRICGGMEAAPPGSEQLRRLQDYIDLIFCPISLIPETVFFSMHVESIWFMSDIVKVWCENALSQSLWPKKQDLELFTGSKSLLTFSESANACFTDRLSESAWVMPRVNRTCSLLHLIWDVPGCTCMLSVFLFGLESVSAFCVIDHSLSTLEMKLWLLVKIWFFADSTDDTCIVWWAELPTTALLSIQSVLGDPGSYSE